LKKEVFALKLELGFIEIKDVQFSKECKVENGTLFVNADDVQSFIYQDDDVKQYVKNVHFDIAKPGESVRITPVKDVIEPRVKVEGPGGEFPGVIAKVDTVGTGKTHVLRGMAVVTAGKIVGFQEGIIDMTGPGAQYTPFSKLLNLVIVCEPVEGAKQHEYEHAVRMVGLRAATFIGELGRNITPDETKTFETYGIKEGMEKLPNLPRVAYVHMLQSQGLLHDTYVYGRRRKALSDHHHQPHRDHGRRNHQRQLRVRLRQEYHLSSPEQPGGGRPLRAAGQDAELRLQHHHQRERVSG
jgi:glycine reductase